MNLVGKIFVFLIFCMSAVFMSFAVVVYAVHTEWRDEVLRTAEQTGGIKSLGLKWQLKNEEDRYKKLVSDKFDLEKKLAATVAADRQILAKQEAANAAMLSELNESRKIYANLVAVHQDVLTKVQIKQGEFVVLKTDNDGLRRDITGARNTVDDWREKSIVMNEKRNQVTGELGRELERKKELVKTVAQQETVLKRAGLTKDTNVGADTNNESIDGVVTRVVKSGSVTYAEISIGTDDRLQVGFSLEVYRGGKYVGQVEVITTKPDKSVVKATRLAAPIEARDRVKTRRSIRETAG